MTIPMHGKNSFRPYEPTVSDSSAEYEESASYETELDLAEDGLEWDADQTCEHYNDPSTCAEPGCAAMQSANVRRNKAAWAKHRNDMQPATDAIKVTCEECGNPHLFPVHPDEISTQARRDRITRSKPFCPNCVDKIERERPPMTQP
jgi:hypothetical protein